MIDTREKAEQQGVQSTPFITVTQSFHFTCVKITTAAIVDAVKIQPHRKLAESVAPRVFNNSTVYRLSVNAMLDSQAVSHFYCRRSRSDFFLSHLSASRFTN